MVSRTSSLPTPRQVYQRLAQWFKHHGRMLPWRGDTDPYRIWVSEIMLVQTTVSVGLKRYPEFIKRFPTVQSLARARVDAVMKAWEGLGYYHRARYLHRATQQIMNEHGGKFPSKYENIRALPGVGDYVAAAVSNFCFGTRIPAVDANVARLGARLFGAKGDVRSPKVRQIVRGGLAKLMTTGDGVLWTDALIDVGAFVCTPRKPKCDDCPFNSFCSALKSGQPEHYGLPEKRAARTTVAVACGIIRRKDGRILIAQRLEHGLLPNLWEFPGGKRDGNERLAETCRREIKEELAIGVTVGARRMVIQHAYSHYTVRLHVFECRYRSGTPRAIGCQKWRWVRIGELKRYAFPTANRKIIDLLATESRATR